MFYSQSNEDRILYTKYLNYKNGFFIELGAMDGITYSNTLFFENTLNWSGVLIEANDQYNQLIQNRPNCHNFNYAVSEIEGDVEFLGNNALGGMVHTMSDSHITGWNLDVNSGKYLVKGKPISKILEPLNIKKVDLFSIDVEGGEFEVLNTFDWDIPVYIVLIELSKHDIKKDEKCRELLKSKGFEFDIKNEPNEIWINKKYHLS
jgi:FkbM family methyltransferase